METTIAGLREATECAQRVTELQALIDDDSVIEPSSLQAGPVYVTASKTVILAAVQAELASELQKLSALGITLTELPGSDSDEPA